MVYIGDLYNIEDFEVHMSRGVASLQRWGGHKQQTYYDPANIIIFELTTKANDPVMG